MWNRTKNRTSIETESRYVRQRDEYNEVLSSPQDVCLDYLDMTVLITLLLHPMETPGICILLTKYHQNFDKGYARAPLCTPVITTSTRPESSHYARQLSVSNQVTFAHL